MYAIVCSLATLTVVPGGFIGLSRSSMTGATQRGDDSGHAQTRGASDVMTPHTGDEGAEQRAGRLSTTVEIPGR